MAVVLIAVFMMSGSGVQERGRRAVADPGGPGMSWVWAPDPVDPAGFGVTLNSNTGAMPSFRVGGVRLWDSGTRWADLEPRRGAFAWAPLDRLVAGARRAGRPVLFVFGGTPAWAAPAGGRSLYADDSRTAPPDSLADWDRFVRELVRRDRGRIAAYELWDTADDQHFYTGSAARLVEMVRRAAGIIRHADPGATVVCPSMERAGEPAGKDFVRRFAALGGYRFCDVAGLKLRQRPGAEPPEQLYEQVRTAYETLHSAGAGIALWNTGPAYDIPHGPRLTGARAADYAVRTYLVGLAARDLHLERTYLYSWGGTRVPVVLQAERRPPTAAARAVGQLQDWLAGASTVGCGHGPAAGLPGAVWRCDFRRPGGAGQESVLWAGEGRTAVPVPADAVAVARIGGRQEPLHGRTLTVTGTPVLVLSRPHGHG